MANTISMQDIRQLNLFEKVTRISTRYSFSYNDTLMFAVPKPLISKALTLPAPSITSNLVISESVISIPFMSTGVKEFVTNLESAAPVDVPTPAVS